MNKQAKIHESDRRVLMKNEHKCVGQKVFRHFDPFLHILR